MYRYILLSNEEFLNTLSILDENRKLEILRTIKFSDISNITEYQHENIKLLLLSLSVENSSQYILDAVDYFFREGTDNDIKLELFLDDITNNKRFQHITNNFKNLK